MEGAIGSVEEGRTGAVQRRDQVAEVDDLDGVADGLVVVADSREGITLEHLETGSDRTVFAQDTLNRASILQEANGHGLSDDVENAALLRVR